MDVIIEQLLRGLAKLLAATLDVPIEQWSAFHWGTVVGVAAVAAFVLWAAVFSHRRSKAAERNDARTLEPDPRSKAADREEAQTPAEARRSKPAELRDDARFGNSLRNPISTASGPGCFS